MSFRDCFLPPPGETSEVLRLFDAAADAVVEQDLALADQLVACADMPSLLAHADRLWGKLDPGIHKLAFNPAYKLRVRQPFPKSERDNPQPSTMVKRTVFERDGWHCRYCGIPVIAEAPFKVLRALRLPSFRWGDSNASLHLGAVLLWGVLDHVMTHSGGGSTVPANLITSCWLCNGAKWNATLEEAELNDPWFRSPVKDKWDGLTRLAAVYVSTTTVTDKSIQC